MTSVDQQLTDLAHGSMPFARELGIRILSAVPERVEAVAEWSADACTVGGVLHGGFLMAAADSVGAMCAVLNLPEDAITSTIESKTNFLRGVTEGEVTFVATPVHVGRTTIVVQTDATRADAKLVTRTTQTQAVITPGSRHGS